MPYVGRMAIGLHPRNALRAPATRLLKGVFYSPFVPQRFVPMLAHNDPADLALLAELVRRGTIAPVIDKTFPLRDAADAIRYVGSGNVRGKVVIRTG